MVLTVWGFNVDGEHVFCELHSTSLYPERSGVHRNGWYVGNALMQMGVFHLKLRNDTRLLALHFWGSLFFFFLNQDSGRKAQRSYIGILSKTKKIFL